MLRHVVAEQGDHWRLTARGLSFLPTTRHTRLFMRATLLTVGTFMLLIGLAASAHAQAGATPADSADDPIGVMVGRLDLGQYKATIKGLTQFGDRRQGTDRNRAAVDWIEAQLKSYGCTNTERIKYVYQPAPPAAPRAGGPGAGGRGGT